MSRRTDPGHKIHWQRTKTQVAPTLPKSDGTKIAEPPVPLVAQVTVLPTLPSMRPIDTSASPPLAYLVGSSPQGVGSSCDQSSTGAGVLHTSRHLADH
jgi:hypothetical protein